MIVVLHQTALGAEKHGLFHILRTGSPARRTGTGKLHHSAKNFRFQPLCSLKGTHWHKLCVVEHKWDIRTVPRGTFPHQREVLIKQITVHLSARLGTLPDIFDRGGAEAGICQQQVFLRAVRVGSAELLPQGLCGRQAHCFFRADSFQTIKETVELRINRTDQHRNVCSLGPKPTAVLERISKIEAVRVGTLAHVRAFCFQSRADVPVSLRQLVVGHSFQLLCCLHVKLLHQRLHTVPAAADTVVQQTFQHTTHYHRPVVQAICCRGLQQRCHFGTAAGLAEYRHAAGIAAKRCNIVPHPPQCQDDIIPTRIAGVCVLLPKIGEIQVAQDVQPVVQ